MRKRAFIRVLHTFSAVALIVAQFILPANVALAQGGNNGNNGKPGPVDTGTAQPVWCQVIGHGWTAQLGDSNSGNNPNRAPLTQLPAGAGEGVYIDQTSGQVYAPNSADPALKGLLDAQCAAEYTVAPPQQIVVCGANNDTITAAANMTISSDSDWSGNLRTITFTADNPYTFLVNNAYTGSETVTYTDANTQCAPTVITPNPTVTVDQICGPQNDTYTVSTSADYTSTAGAWTDGKLTVTFTANAGYVFSNGLATYTVTITDNNEPCEGPIVITPNPSVNVTDVCGTTDNDTFVVSTGHYTVNTGSWLNGSRTFTFTANEGYLFSNNTTTYTVTITDTHTPCAIHIDQPQVSQQAICGKDNNLVTIGSGHYTYTETVWVHNKLTITFTADQGYTFENGTMTTVVLHDKSGPCLIAPPKYTQTTVCGANNDTVAISEGQYTITNDTGWVNGTRTITFKADKGVRFEKGKDGKEYTLTLTDKNTPCIAEYSTQYTYNDQCATLHDTLTLPTDTNQVSYSYIVMPANDMYTLGYFHVTINAKTGYVLDAQGSTAISYNVALYNGPDLTCLGRGGIEPTPTPPAPVITVATAPVAAAPTVTELPHTGPTDNGNAMTIIGLVASFVTYGAVLGLQQRHPA